MRMSTRGWDCEAVAGVMLSVGTLKPGLVGKPAVYIAELDTLGGTMPLDHLSELDRKSVV